MVSAEQQKTANRRLDQWIDNDKRVVTFREVSREVGCHVNTAKNILLRYLNAHPSLAPTYILSGPLKSTSKLAQTQLEPIGPSSPTATQSLAHLATQGVKIVDMDQMSDADRNSEPDEADEMGMKNEDGWPGNDEGAEDGLTGNGVDGMDREDDEVVNEEVPRWGMVLVQGDALEEKKELFETTSLSVHIYALGRAPVKEIIPHPGQEAYAQDPSMYLVPATTLRAHKAYVKPEVYGTITGEGFKPAAGAALKDGGMEWGASGSTKKKDEPVKADKKDAGPSKAEPKAAVVKKADVKQPEVKKEEAEEPKKALATKAKSGKEEKPGAKASQKASQKTKKRVIMSDDEAEEEESPAPVAGSSKTPLAPTSSMTRADDTAAMEAMLGMDFEMSAGEDDEDEAVAKPKPKKAGQVDTESVIKVKTEPGQRKRRKIKDKVTEMDAKGYMDVWREESYSGESEPETESQTKSGGPASMRSAEPAKKPEATKAPLSKPAAKPAPKPAAGGGKKGGQSTLAGFFTKK